MKVKIAKYVIPLRFNPKPICFPSSPSYIIRTRVENIVQTNRKQFIGYAIASGLSTLGCDKKPIVNSDELPRIPAEPPVATTNQNQPTELSRQYPALNDYLADMTEIPAGTYFWNKQINERNEPPKVTVSKFWLGRTPITWQVWEEYCTAQQISLPPRPDWGYKPDHPVVNVSWYDVTGNTSSDGFCAWVSSLTDRTFTIPTETQWEYAARGGRTDDAYPWGDEWDYSKVWCSTRSAGDAKSTTSIRRNNRIYVNRYGLVDIVGNVWQWCIDDYNSTWRPVDDDLDPVNRTVTGTKCLRGGSWEEHAATYFQCAGRYRETPEARNNTTGFRLCFSS